MQLMKTLESPVRKKIVFPLMIIKIYLKGCIKKKKFKKDTKFSLDLKKLTPKTLFKIALINTLPIKKFIKN